MKNSTPPLPTSPRTLTLPPDVRQTSHSSYFDVSKGIGLFINTNVPAADSTHIPPASLPQEYAREKQHMLLELEAGETDPKLNVQASQLGSPKYHETSYSQICLWTGPYRETTCFSLAKTHS